MLFGYATLFVAFFLSVVAAYYSVLGLVAIFSAAAIPVIIMGGALETGKVVAAMWLHRNWNRAPWTYKAYLLPSLLALMLLTSMGTFGYLSKAHSDQSLVSGDVTSKIAIYDEKIKVARENIDANRAALKQLDASVDQTLSRSTTESGAERSVQIRRQQGPERTRLLRDIETEQKKIAQLNEERAPIAAEVRKVEAEVGPIKYIAALIYGDNPENNLLEAAVRWVIILIVVVFDPLAIVLILAGTRHLEWERELKNKQQQVEVEPTINQSNIEQDQSIEQHQPTESVSDPERLLEEQVKDTPQINNLPYYLTKRGVYKVPGIKFPPQVYVPLEVEKVVIPPDQQKNTTDEFDEGINLVKQQFSKKVEIPSYIEISNDYVSIDGKAYHINSLRDTGYETILNDLKSKKDGTYNDEYVLKTNPNITFGLKFPPRPNRGQFHVLTNTVPSKLYSYNGSTWIEDDKNVNTSYTSNEAYIKYLIDQLTLKEIKVEDLTSYEYFIIKEYIENAKSINNSA